MKVRNNKLKNILKLAIVLVFSCVTIFSGIFLSMTVEHKESIAKIDNQNVLYSGTVNSVDKKYSEVVLVKV